MSERDGYRIHRTTVRIDTPDPVFAGFAREMLGAHAAPPAEEPDLQVHFSGYHRFGGPRGSTPPGAGWEKIDSGVYHREGVYRVDRPRFRFEVRHSHGRMQLSGAYRERVDHSLRRVVNRAIVPNNLQQALRHLVLTPLFVLEELNHGALPLHGGVVTRGDRGLLLLGLSGVGKSTLSLHLALQEGWRLVADNYALFDADGVHGIREPARVTPSSLALLAPSAPGVHARLRAASFGERRTLDLSDRFAESAAVEDVLFLRLGDRFTLEPAPSEAMHAMMLRLATAVGEFHYQDPMELCYPAEATAPALRSERTRRFLAGKRCWFATVSRLEPLSRTTERLCDALELL